MLEDIYNPELLNLAANITSIGLIKDADIIETGRSTACGSSITISLKLTGDVITDYGQELTACVLTQASASLLAKNIRGFSHRELEIWHKILVDTLNNKPLQSDNKFKVLEIFRSLSKIEERFESILLPSKTVLSALHKLKSK